jgi:hypothetical protein
MKCPFCNNPTNYNYDFLYYSQWVECIVCPTKFNFYALSLFFSNNSEVLKFDYLCYLNGKKYYIEQHIDDHVTKIYCTFDMHTNLVYEIDKLLNITPENLISKLKTILMFL